MGPANREIVLLTFNVLMGPGLPKEGKNSGCDCLISEPSEPSEDITHVIVIGVIKRIVVTLS